MRPTYHFDGTSRAPERTPSLAEKLAGELYPRDLNFREECDDYKCGAIKSWKEGFLAGFEAARRSDEPMMEEMANCVADYVLGHTHKPEDDHIRIMGDTYGWCSHCTMTVTFHVDLAKEVLDRYEAFKKSFNERG